MEVISNEMRALVLNQREGNRTSIGRPSRRFESSVLKINPRRNPSLRSGDSCRYANQ